MGSSFCGSRAEAAHLVLRPRADVRRGDVAHIVHVEAEQRSQEDFASSSLMRAAARAAAGRSRSAAPNPPPSSRTFSAPTQFSLRSRAMEARRHGAKWVVLGRAIRLPTTNYQLPPSDCTSSARSRKHRAPLAPSRPRAERTESAHAARRCDGPGHRGRRTHPPQ